MSAKGRSGVEGSAFHRDGRGGVFASYVEHLGRRSFSRRSMETYSECLRTLARWMDESGVADVCRVTEAQLQGFQVWMNGERRRGGGSFSLAHQAKHIAVVRGLFGFLEAEGRVFANPAARLKYPKVPRRINREVLDTSDLRGLLSLAGEGFSDLRDAVAVRIMALSGLRISELIALDVSDVNLQAREIVVRGGKGNKDRMTFFDHGTQELLGEYLKRGRRKLARRSVASLVVTDAGERTKPHQVRALVRARGERLGVKLTPHCLRHTFCTLMLRHGANLKVIAELVGHARLSTTARYTRVDIRELARVYRSAHPRCTK